MRFLRFRAGDKIGAGVVYGGTKVIDLGIAFFKHFRRPYKFRDVLEFLQADGVAKLRDISLQEIKNERDVTHTLESVTLLAPIARPPKIVCVGMNYRDHAAEQNQPVPERPLLFMKASNVVIGPDDDIRIPKRAPEQVDYEVELGVVIGKAGFEIPRGKAKEHIFGYTIVNDVSSRDTQFADKQWFRGKSFATFAPMGPYIVTPDEIDAAHAPISLRLNGTTMQSSNTENLVFGPEHLIEYISADLPLEVGDVISTGTPGGVGVFRKPPVFLKAGDAIEAEIEGIGVLRNKVT